MSHRFDCGCECRWCCGEQSLTSTELEVVALRQRVAELEKLLRDCLYGLFNEVHPTLASKRAAAEALIARINEALR